MDKTPVVGYPIPAREGATMNRATRTIVATIGVVLAISGLNHGIFELIQGNTRTDGLIVAAIGPAQRLWQYGTEEAFTVLPTFMLTGLVAVALSLALTVWSVGFVDNRHGTAVLALLFLGLFLFGGGLGFYLISFVSGFAPDTNNRSGYFRCGLPYNRTGR